MALKDYIIRRCILVVPLLLSLTVVTFAITRLAPGDPVAVLLGENLEVYSPKQIEQMREKLNLDKPIWVQYFMWLRDVILLDFGNSFITKLPVSKMLISAIGNTAKLMFTSLLVSIMISIPIGVICAVKRNSIIDKIIMPPTLFGVSMPAFWMAIILILLFSVNLRWFPTSGIQTLGSSSFVDQLWHMVLPVIVLSTKSSAIIIRLTRSGMIEELSKQYVVTARSKGLAERLVVYKHALRNALLPIVTVIGVSIGTLLNGAVITETIFAWPGIGRLIVSGVNSRDYPVLMATVLMAGVLVALTNLLTDVSYAYLDPRVKY